MRQDFVLTWTCFSWLTLQIVRPGSISEMNAFQEFATVSSKLAVNCYFPSMQLNLHTNDIFEVVYNRFIHLSEAYLGISQGLETNVCNLLTFKRQPDKMVRHTQTVRLQKPTGCLSVFDHFVGLVLKGLTIFAKSCITGRWQGPKCASVCCEL